jgi:hypothetical protein
MFETPDFFPEELKPYIIKLKNMYDSTASAPQYLAHPLHSNCLSSVDCRKLVDHLNAKTEVRSWAVASDWSRLSNADQKKIASLSSRCWSHKHFHHMNVSFSTWEANLNNSIIAVNSTFPKLIHFARIERIFTHIRTTTTSEQITDTWLMVKPLPPIPPKDDIFNHVNQPDLQLSLRLPVSHEEYVINIKDAVAHCAWIDYKAGELVSQIKYPVVALVSLDRE